MFSRIISRMGETVFGSSAQPAREMTRKWARAAPSRARCADALREFG